MGWGFASAYRWFSADVWGKSPLKPEGFIQDGSYGEQLQLFGHQPENGLPYCAAPEKGLLILTEIGFVLLDFAFSLSLLIVTRAHVHMA